MFNRIPNYETGVTMPNPRRVIACWYMLVTVGFAALISYSGTPGSPSKPPNDWPDSIPMVHAKGAPALVVFIHPNCPCTQATVSELERLLAELEHPLQTLLLLGCPTESQTAWTESSLAQRCWALRNAQVLLDTDGELAARFGANTSGECILYSADGKRMFHGGITSERGHEGESLGRVAIRELLNGQSSPNTNTPVFGCQLVRTCADKSRICLCCPKEKS